MMFDFVGVGGLAYDIVVRVGSLPAVDGKYPAKNAVQVPGGFIANATCAAGKLGLQTGYIGWIGDDDGGDMLQNDFFQHRVNAEGLDRIAGTQTPFNVIMVDDAGARIILLPPSELYNHSMSPVQETVAARARILYTYPRSIEWCRQLAGIVREHGGELALDVESYIDLSGELLDVVLECSDVLFVAQDNLRQLGRGVSDLPGPKWVISTAGADGAYGYDATHDKLIHEPARQVTVVDSTGAGDAFHAALLAARSWQKPLDEAMAFASVAASIVIQQDGARGGLPTKDEVEAAR